MRPKGMENLAAHSTKKAKRAVTQEKERDEYSYAAGQ